MKRKIFILLVTALTSFAAKNGLAQVKSGFINPQTRPFVINNNLVRPSGFNNVETVIGLQTLSGKLNHSHRPLNLSGESDYNLPLLVITITITINPITGLTITVTITGLIPEAIEALLGDGS